MMRLFGIMSQVRRVSNVFVLAGLAFALVLFSGIVVGADCLILSTGIARAEGKVLKITAPANVYAHLFRPFPVDDGKEVVLQARVKALQNAGSTWTTTIVLYWFPSAYVAFGQQPDGQFRANAQTIAAGGRWDVGIPGGKWVDVKIVLGETAVQLLARAEGGDWVLVKEAPRPESLNMVPFEVMVGKGFGLTSPPYAAEHLDNSYQEPGPIGVAYVDDLVLTVDGRQVLWETFDSLDGWESHVDPNFKADCSFELVPESVANASETGTK